MMAARAAAVLAFLVSAAASVAGERPVPSPALRDRLRRGPHVIGIVHWGLNTYTDREWGYGDADPALLAPSSFDADQIVGACKAGGIGGLVVVAKHHDGFCLWPTKTTDYSISKSPFRGGRGDYVKEMAKACRRAGILFGVYVSPWDRNCSDYGTEKYVETYRAQLLELLGGAYGEVFEMWFDGANGGDGWYGGARETRRIGADYYRFAEVYAFVRKMQPGVTIFGERDDSDFRWPGNERGVLAPSSRATTLAASDPGFRAQLNEGAADGGFFRACEADFPLRRGWFWHAGERGTTKSAAYLTKLYVGSVGNGGTMNIGVAPNRDGVLDDADVRALAGFKVMRDALFAREVKGDGARFNVVQIREDVSGGEQIDGWRIVSGGREILSGTAVGSRRIRLLEEPAVMKDARLEVTAHGPSPRAAAARFYYADPELVRTVLGADGDTRETDTARWMTGARP